jgi:hypothetical protein
MPCRFSIGEYRKTAISSLRLWRLSHRIPAASLRQQGGRISEKKRDKQEVRRRRRDEKSRLPSETFPSYRPRGPSFFDYYTPGRTTPSSYPGSASIKTSQGRLCDCTIAGNCLLHLRVYHTFVVTIEPIFTQKWDIKGYFSFSVFSRAHLNRENGEHFCAT